TTELTEEFVRFTAPEVLEGAPNSLTADLYSLGAVLYRMFGLRDPFDDSDISNLRAKYMCAPPRPLLSTAGVPRWIARFVEKLLHKDPDKRPSLSDVLEAFPRTARAINAPLTGRSNEREAIQAFIESPAQRGLRVILIAGSPGIGKTCFLEELLARSRFHKTLG